MLYSKLWTWISITFKSTIALHMYYYTLQFLASFHLKLYLSLDISYLYVYYVEYTVLLKV